MEWWNNGVMGLKPNIPILQYSNIPELPKLDASRSRVVDLPM
jgi:hypothetical protein